MEFITFVIAVLALVFAYSAKMRVVRLEEAAKHTQMQADASLEQTHKVEHTPAVELPAYIKQHVDAGVAEEDIARALTQNGWEEGDVTRAMDHVLGRTFATRAKGVFSTITKSVSSKTKEFAQPRPDMLWLWLKEDWLLKLGALLFIIGIGWFVTYAFMNNWIGPAGRITLGLLAGAVVLALGAWRMRRFKNQGAVLVALGAGIVTITAVAAREMYGFFTPVTELGIIFLTTVFAAFASVKYESRALAALSIILGHSAPIIAVGIESKLLLFAYLFVVASSTLWVAALTGWRFLTPTSLAFVAFYSIGELVPENIPILFAFAALYFVTNIVAMIKAEKASRSDAYTAAGIALLLVFWIIDAVPDVWQSLTVAGWAVAFAVASFIAFQATTKKEPMLVYSGIAVALLFTATALELKGPALTLAYTFEAAALALAVAFTTGNMKWAQGASMLLILPVVFSLDSMESSAWQTSVLHDDFFVLFSLSAVFLALGAFFFAKMETAASPPLRNGVIASLVTGVLYALAIIWLSLHASFERETATTVALVIYTILGMAAYIRGKLRDSRVLFLSGGVLLGAIVLRLLFIEAWRLDMAGRIVVFLLIGALLITTAFIGRSGNKKHE